MRVLSHAVIALIALSSAVAVPGNLLTNGGFELGLKDWRPLWCRQTGVGTVRLDPQGVHSGTNSANIQHRGGGDWSLEPELRIAAQTGEIFELEAWVKLEGAGSVTLCASTWDPQGRTISWAYGERTAHANAEWRRLSTRFVIPAGVAAFQPRLIGSGEASIQVDDVSLRKISLGLLTPSSIPARIGVTNSTLILTMNTGDATFTVFDRRTSHPWEQHAINPELIVKAAQAKGNRIELNLLHVPTSLNLHAILELDAKDAEFTLALSGTGELPNPLAYPHPFTSKPGDHLIVPMNEGISYPVEDPSIEPVRLIAYGGHGICMAFWGVTDGAQGHAVIIETPDDAAIRIHRVSGRLAIAPEWDSQKGQLGYERRLRYVFFDHGDHVTIAKRYRAYVQRLGRLKTLAQKRRERPAVDLLLGAVNVWNWDSEPVALVKEMQAAGIDRILWSRGGPSQALRELNELHVLTSRYDIYQDAMDPANFPLLKWLHPDWTSAGWPNDIIRREDGTWLHGWGVEGKNGGWYDCGLLCDRRALDYARARIASELATKPYTCRFIDTTTAAPWNECYATNHPMTRAESREWKMRLLNCVSSEFKLVTGSETGHDAAVPFVDYFEGMLSLGPYRVPDAGRDMQRIWTEPPERVVKFQLGQGYRLPLWELVYHDCVVAQWYWGDYNNKLPSLWKKRDLFNALYGTPPMFMFNHALWESERERFVQSYRNTSTYALAAAYSEMTNHCFLTADRNVQQTSFANGVTVTVNFGTETYRRDSQTEVQAGEATIRRLH